MLQACRTRNAIVALSPPGRRADSPSVAVDQQGNFTVAWTVLANPGGVQAARLPAGANVFEATETVSSVQECLPFPNVVAVAANGTAVIVLNRRASSSRVRGDAIVLFRDLALRRRGHRR